MRKPVQEEEETENVENDGKDAHQEPSTSASVSLLSISTSGDVRLPRKRCRQHSVYGCSQCLNERRTENDGGDGDPPDISSTTPDVSDSPSGSRRRKSRPVRVMRACTAPAVPCQPSYDCLPPAVPPPPPHFPRETVKRQQCHPVFNCKKQRLCVVSSSWEQPDTATPTLLHTQMEEPDSSTHPSIKSEPACVLSSSVPDSHPYYQHPAQSHYFYNMQMPYPQSQPPPQPQYGFPSYPAAQHQPQPQYSVLQYSQPSLNAYSSVSSASTLSEPQEGLSYSKLEPICPDSGGGEEESRLGETELAAYKNKMDSVRCGVCGDAAAGFHCGAYVCEACKKFYIRSTKADNSSRYQCSKSGQCDITKDTRTHCQYCRYKKCEVLGMYPPGSKPSENSNISVIPCRVCGANSSGFHFGAITCEGCKGFFRRTVNERESNRYQCSKGGICDITVTTRNNCKSCRYKKCRSVGMSKDGSRIGRQPNAIKHMCAKEIEAIQSLMPFTSLPMQVKPPPSVLQPMTTLESREEAEQRAYLGYFRSQVVRASKHLFAMIEDELVPQTSRLSLDMPRERVWKVMMEFFETHAVHVVRFMREIPGFLNLYQKLRPSSKLFVQEAMYPIMLIMLGQNYDLKTGAYNYFSFLPCDKDVIMTTFPTFENICGHLSTSGHLIKRIGFDPTEVALLCAIELTRNELMDEEKQRLVTALYERCLQSLDFYMQEKGDSHVTLAMISELQKMLTAMNQEHHSIILDLKQTHPNLTFPNLYMEMFVEEPVIESGSRSSSIEESQPPHIQG